MKVTCICGSTTMEFKSLSEKDFPNGWEGPCCKVEKILEGRKIAEATQTKPLLEQWLDSTGLRNRTHYGCWVSSTSCYREYRAWLTNRGLQEHLPTVTKFGRDMRKITPAKRKDAGKFYLLERDIP